MDFVQTAAAMFHVTLPQLHYYGNWTPYHAEQMSSTKW